MREGGVDSVGRTDLNFGKTRTAYTFKFAMPRVGQLYKFYIREVNPKGRFDLRTTNSKHCYKLVCKSADIVPVCQVVIARCVGRMAHDRRAPQHAPLHPFVLILRIFQSSTKAANKFRLPFVFAKKTVKTPFNPKFPPFYIAEADGVERRWNPFEVSFMLMDKLAY